MNNPILSPRMAASEWEPKFPFDLVVAYEDTFTRDRAMRLYDHLAEQLLNDYDFQCSWWKFDHLVNPTLRHQAADAAANANMVILSLRAQEEVSPLHRTWIEEWLAGRDSGKAALVALIAGGNDAGFETTPMLAYLQNAARLGRMDFFNHGFELDQAQGLSPSPPRASANPITQRAQVVPPLLHETMPQRSPTPRWGINE